MPCINIHWYVNTFTMQFIVHDCFTRSEQNVKQLIKYHLSSANTSESRFKLHVLKILD